jgi:soluble lytic murein transglycosylase-like protein
MGQLAGLLAQAPATSEIFAQPAAAQTASEAAIWPIVQAEAAAARVDPAVVMAIISHESNFKVRAINPHERTGGPSVGLMQVQVPTAAGMLGQPDLTLEQLYDPQTNIRAGTRYLAQQLRRYGGDLATALAAYNAGTAFRRADGTFVNQAYVDAVLARLGRYQAIAHALGSEPAVVASWPAEAAGAGGWAAAWPLLAGAGVLGLAVMARLRRRP